MVIKSDMDLYMLIKMKYKKDFWNDIRKIVIIGIKN